MITNCYRNLTDHCISYFIAGDRVKHCQSIALSDVRFHVREGNPDSPARGTRQWTLANKRKCVHAFVKGEVINVDGALDLDSLIPVTYNPYRGGCFVRLDNGKPVTHANKAVVTTAGVFIEV
jgi:hypothetical protein